MTLERIKSEHWKNPNRSSLPEFLTMPDVAQERLHYFGSQNPTDLYF